MRNQEMNPTVERVVFMLVAVGCSIWILQYDLILLIPILGLVASTRELNALKNVEDKP